MNTPYIFLPTLRCVLVDDHRVYFGSYCVLDRCRFPKLTCDKCRFSR